MEELETALDSLEWQGSLPVYDPDAPKSTLRVWKDPPGAGATLRIERFCGTCAALKCNGHSPTCIVPQWIEDVRTALKRTDV